MELFLVYIVIGLAVLVWSSDKFVEGASRVAGHYGMSPLLIGMLIIGFGTSAPEIVVSAISSSQGNPGLALGNAFGSNIANIGLILGITAIYLPVAVHSKVLKKELPILSAVCLLAVGLLYDLELSRFDAIALLIVFVLLMSWTVYTGLSNKDDALAAEVEVELSQTPVPLGRAYAELFGGLILLVVSSRALVYGAVGVAKGLGVSDVIIGLTIVAIGTSLPELASSVAAARKGESDIALGNVVGSNLFNTLAVIGISGSILPYSVDREIFYRDSVLMLALTFSLFILGYRFKGQGRISRIDGVILLTSYVAYTVYLIKETIG